MPLPDDVNVDCIHQKVGPSSLVCKIADPAKGTVEVNPETCFDCPIGKIYRELGCENISGKTYIIPMDARNVYKLMVERIWCTLRKRETNYDFCLKCPYVGNEFIKPNIKKTVDFFDKLGFSEAKKNFVKAQNKLNEGDQKTSITNSISAIESTFKSILDSLKAPYPAKQTVTGLWKTVKDNLHLGDEISSKHLEQVVGSFTGAISGIGGLRNDLSDAHGKGLISSEIYDSYAELAFNLSVAICLFVIRRYLEVHEVTKKDG
jgi:hypothetical protein